MGFNALKKKFQNPNKNGILKIRSHPTFFAFSPESRVRDHISIDMKNLDVYRKLQRLKFLLKDLRSAQIQGCRLASEDAGRCVVIRSKKAGR
jgi:hypothetical protein